MELLALPFLLLFLASPIAGIWLLVRAIAAIRRKAYPKALAFGAAASVLLVSFVAIIWTQICKVRELSRRTNCQSNLHSFDVALSGYVYPPQTCYPTNLTDLPATDIAPDMFVCTGSGNALGSGTLSNATELSDYIYISGLNPSAPAGVPVIICPPMFHQGKGGIILDTDHSTRFYRDTNLVDALIDDPLLRWPDAPPEIRSNVYVHVSKRLTELSKGKYRSHGLK